MNVCLTPDCKNKEGANLKGLCMKCYASANRLVSCDGNVQLCYFVHLQMLTEEQLDAVIRICNARHPEVPFEQCKAEIWEHGLPLRTSQTDFVQESFI